MDFIYLLRILGKKKWTILSAGILAACIAYVVTINQPKKYRSSAQITTGFTVPDETRPNNNYNYMETENNFNNVIATFTSPAVVSLLSYDLIVHDLSNPTPFHRVKREDLKAAGLASLNMDEAKKVFQEKLESMSMLTSYKPEEKNLLTLLDLYGYDYKTISKNLTVGQMQHTDFLQVDYVSDNPDLSAYVVNDAFQQFIHYYGSLRGSRSKESIDTLRSIMEKKRQAVDAINATLKQKGIVTTDDKGNSNVDRVAALDNVLTDAEAKRNDLDFDLKKVNARIENLSHTATPKTQSNNEELVAAKKAQEEAYSAYLNNPGDKSLLAKYNQLNKEYLNKLSEYKDNADDASSSVDRTETKAELLNKRNDIMLDMAAADKNISVLKNKVAALRGSIYSNVSHEASEQSVIQEAEFATKEYLDAQKAYNQAVDFNNASVSNFKMIVPGQPAIFPEPSKRALIVAGAGIAALITTMLVIILLTYMDSSIKTPMIFSRTVGLKLMSMVNFANLRNKSLADIVANREVDSDAYDKNRNNIFRESLRKLRYEIEMSGKKIFLFTSTKKGQGKTTLIQALSYSMSMSKKKILIIDTNFCNNDLTVQLNAEPVLEKIVPFKASSTGTLLEQVKVVSKEVGIGTVYAIGAEAGDYTPSEILPRENLLHHLHSLTYEYDYIFLEGPPLNDFSDSKELAQYVDGVIAVFSASHIIKQIDKQSISFFKELNGKFSGCILNMVDMSNVNTV